MDKDYLIKEFNKIENELIETLKKSEIVVDEKRSSSAVLKDIKKSVLKVSKAKLLFNQYEIIAKQIQNFSDDEDDNLVLEKIENDNKIIKAIDINEKKSKKVDKSSKKLKTENSKNSENVEKYYNNKI